jgi:hypothetical protein
LIGPSPNRGSTGGADSVIAFASFFYLIGAVFVGVFGLDRRLGFLGFFVLSLIFSPPLVFVILLVTRPISTDRLRRPLR